MTAASFWFGPPDRPLFGHLHVPAGGCARGGVVICPTIGIEASYAEHSLRLLARQLADAGLLALRFDYDGAGQSAGGLTDPDRLTAWLASIGHAVSLVRAAGATWVGGVGFRLGATLAANPDSAGTASTRSCSGIRTPLGPRSSASSDCFSSVSCRRWRADRLVSRRPGTSTRRRRWPSSGRSNLPRRRGCRRGCSS